MRFSQIITENQNIVYHGDDFGTTQLQAQYMMHGGSNNQEGVGIYFSPKLEVAQTYGKHISTISLDGLRIENSRALVADVVPNGAAIKFLEYLNQHNDEFWYLLTDYGIEVSNQREVKSNHLSKLHSMMRDEELRNWQIELAQTTDINVFVSGWNQFIRIDALYEQVRQFYAVINTRVPVTLLPGDDLSENEQLDEISVMSSWIADLSYQDRILYLTLKNGRRYEIFGLSPAMARQWLRAPSKGKFWHSNIRGNYRVSRI